jgi:hypothetical protein
MINRVARIRCRPLAFAVFGFVLGGLAALPGPANARVWIGFGFPLVVGPPAYYYPPPAYYYPPPAYYPSPACYGAPPAPPYGYAAPPPGYSRPGAQYGQSCATGGAVCPMEHPVASGSSCYCTTAQGRVWGRAT